MPHDGAINAMALALASERLSSQGAVGMTPACATSTFL